MDTSIAEALRKLAESQFSEHPLLRELAADGDGKIKFCGACPWDTSSEESGKPILRVRCSFIAGSAFLYVDLDAEMNEGEYVAGAIERVFLSERA